MNSMLFVLISIALTLLFIGWAYHSNHKNNTLDDEIEAQQEEIEILNNLIIAKQEQYLSYERDIKKLKREQNTIKETTVPYTVNEALQRYESNNIKIPLDIIDDASLKSFNTISEAIDYIEGERKNWTLENRKKLRS